MQIVFIVQVAGSNIAILIISILVTAFTQKTSFFLSCVMAFKVVEKS